MGSLCENENTTPIVYDEQVEDEPARLSFDYLFQSEISNED